MKSKTKMAILSIILLIALSMASIAWWKTSNMGDKRINNASNPQNEINQQEEQKVVSKEEIENTSSPSTDKVETSKEKELFEDYMGKAEQLLETMSMEEKVGQMFLVRYPEKGVLTEIKEEAPGGYILFGRDFKGETKDSILKELTNCQNASKIELALGVDEEGGTVTRVSSYKAFRKEKFQSPQELWKKGQLQAILDDSKEKTELLKSIGLNMNLVPVADVPTSSKDFIYKRAYGRGAQKTATYVAALIKTMNADGMISTMKHFPGYGNNVDTHTGIAIDKRPYATFEESDFLPFKSGIEVGAPTILVSHNIVNCMDDSKPASLSEKVHEILREDLNFTGIIMTDDLAMDAVKDYVKNGEAAVQAVLAGNDIILSSDFKKQKTEILKAVEEGKIEEEVIDRAVTRILAWKYAYHIIKN